MTREQERDRVRRNKADAERASRELTDRLRARIASDAFAHKTVHLLGEKFGRTWCDKGVGAGIAIADTRARVTCEACIELDDCRRAGIRSGAYKHPADAELDKKLGIHRPPTQGT